MNFLYRESKGSKEKATRYLIIALLFSLLIILFVLLIFFLHPRNQTWPYFSLCLALLLLLVFGDYFLLFYKLAHLKAIDSFLKTNGKHQDNAIFTFEREEGVRYINKLSFRVVLFLDEKNEERKFLYLEECSVSFEEKKKYELSFEREYLFGYRGSNDER